MEVIFTLPLTTLDIRKGTALTAACSPEAEELTNTVADLSSLWFLGRQGLVITGDGNESDGNFQQLLQMKAEEDSNLAEWLK